MSLTITSIPIGNPLDITHYAIQELEGSDLVIGEDRKPLIRFLKSVNCWPKNFYLLNEHSSQEDFDELLDLCQTQKICLISDCGTPAFQDPGAELVQMCHENNIPVRVAPGASSLMAFISLCGTRLPQFYFRGFLPAKTEQRQMEWKKLTQLKDTFIIIMDTPYRLQKTLLELKKFFPLKTCTLGTNLTCENQLVLKGTPDHLIKTFPEKKAEFLLLIENK